MKKQFVFFIGVALCAFSHLLLASEIEDPERDLHSNVVFVPPYFIEAPSDTFINCGDPLPPVPEIMAFDQDDNAFLSVSYQQFKAGTRCGTVFYERVWTAVSATAETITHRQTIRYMDTTPPVLEIPQDTTIQCGEPIPEPSYHSYDACSWNEVTFSETRMDINDCEYTLVRSWMAKDGCNNWIKKEQTINIVDTIAPMITLINPDLQDIMLGQKIREYDCTIPHTTEDDILVLECCADVEIEAYDRLLNTNQCAKNGYFRKWRCGYIATDGAGNRSEFYFFIEQYDTISPQLHNVPDDLILECGDSIPPADPSVVFASDNCSTRHIPQVSDQYFVDPADSMNHAVIRTWSFEDDCGNHAEASQRILVCDFDTTLFNPDTTIIDTMNMAVADLMSGNPSQFSGQNVFLEENQITIYPNPTQDKAQIKFNLEYDDLVSIRITDNLGRIVYNKQKPYWRGENEEIIPVNEFADGIYMIVLNIHGNFVSKKVLKTH